MPTPLLVPPPANYSPAVSSEITSDMLGVCDALAALSPRLVVVEHASRSAAPYYSILWEEGSRRTLVMDAAELDQRVVDRCRYLLATTAVEREAEMQRDAARSKQAAEREAAERAADAVDSVVRRAINRDVHLEPDPVSLRPLNRAARRAGRRA